MFYPKKEYVSIWKLFWRYVDRTRQIQDLRPDWIDITVTASIPTTATALQLRFLETEKVFRKKRMLPRKNRLRNPALVDR